MAPTFVALLSVLSGSLASPAPFLLSAALGAVALFC